VILILLATTVTAAVMAISMVAIATSSDHMSATTMALTAIITIY
jgi:hypothetical protein